MQPTLCENDAAFGPAVLGCRGNFDFTLFFEKVVMSIVPNAIFCLLAVSRIVLLCLGPRPRVVEGLALQWLKVAVLVLYAAVQFSLLGVVTNAGPDALGQVSTAALGLASSAGLIAVLLSYAEHALSPKPSLLLEFFLGLTLLCDLVQTRTAWLLHHHAPAALYTTSVTLKATALFLEARPKGRWVRSQGKTYSPDTMSGVFGLMTYSWVNSLLWRGFNNVLNIEDLHQLDERMEAFALHQVLGPRLPLKKSASEDRLGLVRDLYITMPGAFLYPIVPRLCLIAFRYCQPLFIDQTLDYLAVPEPSRDPNHGYGLIAASFFIYTGIAVSSGVYQYYNQKLVYTIRSCLCAAIYRKTTEMKCTLGQDAAAVTLMSTDLERIVRGGQMAHEVWATVIEIAIGCWLLEGQIGVAFVTPLAVIAVCSVFMWLVAKKIGKRQRAWMDKIQHRVGLTASAIAQMKQFKMSGMAEMVGDMIQHLRDSEIAVGKRFRWLSIASIGLGSLPTSLSPVVTFALTQSKLDASTTFASYAYILLVTAPLVGMFQLFPAVLAALACLQRIQNFLSTERRVDFRSFREENSAPGYDKKLSAPESEEKASGYAFSIQDGTFGWTADVPVLRDLNCRFPKHALTTIAGPIASGKSTLCKVLLGEVPIHSGKVLVELPERNIGYCEQDPFLYNGTLQDNIVGRSVYDQRKFEDVLVSTLLDFDVTTLRQGSLTMVGSGGIALSGGQKQRVSIARALYSGAKTLIFDDVLSGLDLYTESQLFRNVFGPEGFIKRHHITAILCTHSIRHLPQSDHIILLTDKGTIAEAGSFESLSRRSNQFQSLGIEMSGAVPDDDTARNPPAAANASSSQTASMRQTVSTSLRQTGDWKVYKHWFSSVSPQSTASLFLASLVYGFSSNFSTVWLNYWSQDSFHRSATFYAGIYALLGVAQLLSMVLSAVATFISMITFAGSRLHRRAIGTVITAPLSFLTSTDTGAITNHFSQDLTLIDGELLYAFVNVALLVMQGIGMAFVIVAGSPYLAAGYPVLLGALYIIQGFYLRTSRQMRLLDLEAKSPLYTHFLDTINGIATIRAFGWEPHDTRLNDELLDRSQRPAYLLAMIQQWLRVVMQMVVAGLAVALVSLSTQLDANVGLTGTGLVTLLSFGTVLTELIQSYTGLETCIGAVSRLGEFSASVTSENGSGQDLKPANVWPENGAVELKNVCVTYESKSEAETASAPAMTLRDLSLSITPGQKVAICGRTGSGKSTLMLLLLGLIDPMHCSDNSIVIDSMPLCRIQKSKIRQFLIAIPQDAAFLPGQNSIKLNIDPFNAATAQDCQSVLELVGLSSFLDARGGVEASMSAEDLSAGQQQLFGLARAIVRKRVRSKVAQDERAGGILLLDEVSSKIDHETDRRMQSLIQDEFKNYTIIAVSHRLETVVESFDTVVVLDKGTIVELGHPKSLLEIRESYFRALWAEGNKGSPVEL